MHPTAPRSPGSTTTWPSSHSPSPYLDIPRAQWAALTDHVDIELTDDALAELRGLGDPTSLADVREVYVPLTQLLHLYMRHTGHLYRSTAAFLDQQVARTPFIIGIAGSVGVGKSTTARLLQQLLRQAPGAPSVNLVTTDGFLHPNHELERRGILDRKGFPESYDRRALLTFLAALKSGAPSLEVPTYSHLVYDIIPGQMQKIEQPDILVLEGLNVLQPPRLSETGEAIAVSDYFDFSVYVDADEALIRQWFMDRFRTLRQTAFQDEQSYFRRFAEMELDEAMAMADQVWDTINGPNLANNILPTRERATAILVKGPDHVVSTIKVRKL